MSTPLNAVLIRWFGLWEPTPIVFVHYQFEPGTSRCTDEREGIVDERIVSNRDLSMSTSMIAFGLGLEFVFELRSDSALGSKIMCGSEDVV